MNDKAQIAMRAIDKAMASITDKETRDQMQKARNHVELLGDQCDQAERIRHYWCKVATRLMRQNDALRSAPPTIIHVSRQDLLYRRQVNRVRAVK